MSTASCPTPELKIIARLSPEAGNGLLGPQRRRKLWNVTVGQPSKLAEEQRKSLCLVSIAVEKMSSSHSISG